MENSTFEFAYLDISKEKTGPAKAGPVKSSYLIVMLHLFATFAFPVTPGTNIRACGPAWFLPVASVQAHCSQRFRTSF